MNYANWSKEMPLSLYYGSILDDFDLLIRLKYYFQS